MKTWAEVSDSPAFSDLTINQQEAARNQYFNSVVAPKVPADKLPAVKSQFDYETKDTGVDDLVHAISGVENGSGDPNAVSVQGASGRMQIEPGTFDRYKMPGEVYSNDNDRVAAAIRKIKDDYNYYGGDLGQTAAAYIGGRGAVRDDGTIRDDVSDALGTTPAAYADKVLGKIDNLPRPAPPAYVRKFDPAIDSAPSNVTDSYAANGVGSPQATDTPHSGGIMDSIVDGIKSLYSSPQSSAPTDDGTTDAMGNVSTSLPSATPSATGSVMDNWDGTITPATQAKIDSNNAQYDPSKVGMVVAQKNIQARNAAQIAAQQSSASPLSAADAQRPAAGALSTAKGLVTAVDMNAVRVAQGFVQMYAEATGNDDLANHAASVIAKSHQVEQANDPRFQSELGDASYGQAKGFATAVPGLLATAINPVLGAGTFAAQSAGESYGDLRASGVDPSTAMVSAGAQGAIMGAMATLPLNFVAQNFGKTGVTQFAAGLIARDVPAMYAQGMASSFVNNEAHGTTRTVGEWLDDQPAEFKQAAISALVFSAGTTAAHAAIHAAPEIANRLTPQADQFGRALGQDVASAQFNPADTQSAAVARLDPSSYDPTAIQPEQQAAPFLPPRATISDISNTGSVDDAIKVAQAAVDSVRVAPVNDVTSQLDAIRPTKPKAAPEPVASPTEQLSNLDDLQAQAGHQKDLDADNQAIAAALSGSKDAVTGDDGSTIFRGDPVVAVAKEALPDHSTAGANELSRDQADAFGKLLGLKGQKLTIFQDHPNLPDAFVDPNDPSHIFMSTSTTRGADVVAFHEILHTAEKSSPEAYSALLGVIRDEMRPGGMAEARAQHGDLTDDGDLHREIASDIAGNAIRDPQFMSKVIDKMQARYGDQAQPMAQKFIDAMSGMIARIKELVKGGLFNKSGSQQDVANAYVKNLERVHDAMADVFAQHFGGSAIGKVEAVKQEAVKQGNSVPAQGASPALEKGHTRLYHGGEPGDYHGPLWFSSQQSYAKGYADKSSGRVWYVDVPTDHPLIAPEYQEQSIAMGHHVNVELPAEIAAGRKAFPNGETVKPQGIKAEVARIKQAKVAKPEVAPVTSLQGAAVDHGEEALLSEKRNLTDDERAVEGRFNAQVDAHGDEMADKYLGIRGTRIDPDLVKKASPDYRANPTKYTDAVHEPSSKLAKLIYAKALTRVKPGDHVLFTAGGGGSGKSESLERHLENSVKPAVIYDSTLSSVDSASKRIDQALAVGAKVDILYTNRPVDKAFDFSLTRPRVVPLDVLAQAHVGASDTIRALAEKYQGNPDVSIKVMNNHGTVEQMTPGKLDDVPKYDYNQIERGLYDIAHQRLEADQITRERFNLTTRSTDNERDGASLGRAESGQAGQPENNMGGAGGHRGPDRRSQPLVDTQGLDNPDIRASTKREPTFYSQLDRSIDQVPTKVDNTSAANWKAWLLNNAGKMGVKADEIKWSGISDYLDLMGKQKLSKEQIHDYLAQNGVKVTEAQKGTALTRWEGNALYIDGKRVGEIKDTDSGYKFHAQDGTVEPINGDRMSEAADAIEAKYGIADKIADGDGPTKYGKYVLPGGENYRELLLTLPAKVAKVEFTPLRALPDGYHVSFDQSQPDGHQYAVIPPDQGHGQPYGGLRSTTAEEAKAGALQILNSELENAAHDKARAAFEQSQYKSSHWDEPNILAHVRFNDRTDADGKKVLFIEELQSDFGQDGKKNGFTMSDADYERTQAALQTRLEAAATPEERSAIGKEWNALHDAKDHGVPDAPFVTDTKGWLSLGIKRMIRYAAENGYDKVAFANGDQSAARYDLSKSINRISLADNSSGGIGRPSMAGEFERGRLTAYDHDGNNVIDKHIDGPSELEDHIGKDAAQNLLNAEPKEGRSAGLGVRVRELNGQELQVGGEGMKKFYNEIVPQTANDVLKKLGGGKVGEVNLTGHGTEDLRDMYSPNEASFQPGFDITPQMRESALQGQPLFSERRAEDVPLDDAAPEKREYNGPGAELIDATKTASSGLLDNLLGNVSPLSLGSDRARAMAFDFAAARRKAQYEWQRIDNVLTKNFTGEQRKEMWEAAEEQNELMLKGEDTTGKGIDRLPADQRKVMDWMSDHGNALLDQAKELGMFKGDGVAYWSPRMAVQLSDEGIASRISDDKNTSGNGGISTSASSLKGRNHEFLSDSEAALKAKFGDDAQYLRDIRTMPLAMQALERAIAGRDLINKIKQAGKDGGEDLVTTSEPNNPEFFTIKDNPAFYTTQPRILKDHAGDPILDENGKVQMVKDQDGNPVFDRVPLYIRKEFEGPLNAVMTQKNGDVYKALMGIKGAAMSAIMFTPMTHMMTEIGRALPLLRTRIVPVWFVGNKAKNDPTQMGRAIEGGLVPIGGSHGLADITGMVDGNDLQPGNAWATRQVGNLIGKVNTAAGEGFKKGADAFGQFWHGTMLWDRIGDLQMGIYKYYKADLMKKGASEESANVQAAHFANRYAGAIKPESVPGMTGKILNVLMFSRSFTLGNLGAMKDCLTGLPKDVQSKILMDAMESRLAGGASKEDAAAGAAGELKSANTFGKWKSREAMAVDLATMVAITSLGQTAVNYLRGNSQDDDEKSFLDRLGALGKKTVNSPGQVFNHPLDAMMSLSSTSTNEAKKENRILIGYDKDGTAEYARLSFGKIGEEFAGWLGNPIDKFKSKLSTLVKPNLDAITNDVGFGRPLFDPDATGVTGAAVHVGNYVTHLMKAQVPAETIQAAYDWATGHASEIDKLKVGYSLFGIPISKGDTGGPAMAAVHAEEDRVRLAKLYNMPDINRALKVGDEDKAREVMDQIGMTPREQNKKIANYDNPRTMPTRSQMKSFNSHANEDEATKMEQATR